MIIDTHYITTAKVMSHYYLIRYETESFSEENVITHLKEKIPDIYDNIFFTDYSRLRSDVNLTCVAIQVTSPLKDVDLTYQDLVPDVTELPNYGISIKDVGIRNVLLTSGHGIPTSHYYLICYKTDRFFDDEEISNYFNEKIPDIKDIMIYTDHSRSYLDLTHNAIAIQVTSPLGDVDLTYQDLVPDVVKLPNYEIPLSKVGMHSVLLTSGHFKFVYSLDSIMC